MVPITVLEKSGFKVLEQKVPKKYFFSTFFRFFSADRPQLDKPNTTPILNFVNHDKVHKTQNFHLNGPIVIELNWLEEDISDIEVPSILINRQYRYVIIMPRSSLKKF